MQLFGNIDIRYNTLFAEKVCKLTFLFAVNVCNVKITNVLFGV